MEVSEAAQRRSGLNLTEGAALCGRLPAVHLGCYQHDSPAAALAAWTRRSGGCAPRHGRDEANANAHANCR